MKLKEIGKDQLNTERGNLNERVKKLRGLGNTKGVKWRSGRRNRAI